MEVSGQPASCWIEVAEVADINVLLPGMESLLLNQWFDILVVELFLLTRLRLKV
jgi:hypothetical protein